MAYIGGIRFMEIPLGSVDWSHHLRFDEKCDHAIISNLWTFQNCKIRLYGAQYIVLDYDGTRRGQIWYDVEGSQDFLEEQCVVVGRKRKDKDEDKEDNTLGVEEYYVLAVRPTKVDGEYRRTGVGLIQSNCVVGQRINIRVV
jgi:hypothetical protein